MKNIIITGAENLSRLQLFNLGRISKGYYNKIERVIHNDFALSIKLKCHEKVGIGGKAKEKIKPRKFGVQLQVKTATKGLDSSASDWDLNRALHSSFKKLLSEIEHRFRASNQNK